MRRKTSASTGSSRTTNGTAGLKNMSMSCTSFGKGRGTRAPSSTIRPADLYADPSKIHRIHHHGQRYKVLGPHLSQPSPQRTPVLFQAGSSRAGRTFAARHAEGTFLLAANPQGAKAHVEETRAFIRAAGRDPDDLLFVQGLSFVVGGTEEEARRKARDLEADVSVDGLLAHISRDLGIDLGLLDPSRPVDELEIEGVQGVIRAFEEGNPGRKATVADLGRSYATATQIVGTPETIADQLAEWQAAGVDGVNVIYHTLPGSFVDFVENVTPVLQKRGLAQTDYAEGTYREQLFPGRSARLVGAPSSSALPRRFRRRYRRALRRRDPACRASRLRPNKRPRSAQTGRQDWPRRQIWVRPTCTPRLASGKPPADIAEQ